MTNEAAERLRAVLRTVQPDEEYSVDEALAAERKATVERIRSALERIAADLPGEDFRGVYAILAAEAAR